ncbi:hypothetical protein DH86_00002272, partial [Scytalidium sp. 3C]
RKLKGDNNVSTESIQRQQPESRQSQPWLRPRVFNASARRRQAGKGLIKVNGKPLSLLQPEVLRFKVYEPLLIVGVDKFAG